MVKLYIYRIPLDELRRIRECHESRRNIAHGQNPPMVDFNENPAALDALLRHRCRFCDESWCRLYRRHHRNGLQIVIVDRRTRLPVDRQRD